MICVEDKNGMLLPITVKPYRELLEHMRMSAEEYVRAVGDLLKNKVVSIKKWENHVED